MTLKYKLIQNPHDSDDYTITRISDFASIPISIDNADYQQFVQDVVGIGTTCVEGPTVGVTTAYNIARQAEYPSWEEQQDMQYWDAINGTTTWKDKITSIKTKYPKNQSGVTTIGSLPNWVVGLSTS